MSHRIRESGHPNPSLCGPPSTAPRPGMVNTHAHMFQSLNRCMAQVRAAGGMGRLGCEGAAGQRAAVWPLSLLRHGLGLPHLSRRRFHIPYLSAELNGPWGGAVPCCLPGSLDSALLHACSTVSPPPSVWWTGGRSARLSLPAPLPVLMPMDNLTRFSSPRLPYPPAVPSYRTSCCTGGSKRCTRFGPGTRYDQWGRGPRGGGLRDAGSVALPPNSIPRVLRGTKRNRESSRANAMTTQYLPNAYQITTFYRTVTLCCRAAAETEPRTNIERRRHSNRRRRRPTEGVRKGH
jgi:hypothetical protein